MQLEIHYTKDVLKQAKGVKLTNNHDNRVVKRIFRKRGCVTNHVNEYKGLTTPQAKGTTTPTADNQLESAEKLWMEKKKSTIISKKLA